MSLRKADHGRLAKHWADKPVLRDIFWFLVLPHQFKQWQERSTAKTCLPGVNKHGDR